MLVNPKLSVWVWLVAARTSIALYTTGNLTVPCDSPIYCYGDLLREIELASPFADSKTFVDLPTVRPLDEVLAAFNNLSKPISNNSALNEFLSTYFGQAGSELSPVPEDELSTDPVFLDHVNNTDLEDFVRQVIDIWPDLTRQYVGSSNCTGCVDSFIPVNRTFVVAGGRFREYYYWDSYWIIEGLLRTRGSFTQIARNIIENFLDLVDEFGFVPNGGRLYYLNRSQPPLLTQMVSIYVQYTNDTSLLTRALPILEKEYSFWTTNRSITVNAASGNWTLNHYAVSNNQPRPESYREDYISANNLSYYATSGIIYPVTTPLNDSQKATLYQNLASGAESGWDYSSRWIANPADAAEDVYFPLRSLNTVQIVPVDLNSILYANEITISTFLNETGNITAGAAWASRAAYRSDAIHALLWNSSHNSYFDYNMTSAAQNVYIIADPDAVSSETSTTGAPAGYQLSFSPAQFYPFWLGAAKPWIKNNPLAVSLAYERVADLLSRKAGGIAATNLFTGQQWDEPNVWPPLMYVLMKGLLNTPATFGTADEAYTSIQSLALELGQRYLASTFCTWRATGGATATLPRIQDLGQQAQNGTIFEKYADNSTNRVGGGGEYEVVEGFGWSNGVLIWVADQFGPNLTLPDCGDLTVHSAANRKRDIFALREWGTRSAVELHTRDAAWVAKYR